MAWLRFREWIRKTIVLGGPKCEKIWEVKMILMGTQEITKETLQVPGRS